LGSLLLILGLSSLISFIGSLQLGPVNLFVINASLYQGKKTAYLVAIGGCIPEFIYCSFAVFANNYLLEYEWLIFSLRIAFTIILLIIGFTFYFKKRHTVELANENYLIKSPVQYIFKGFSLAALNPQLLPFWIFVQIYFNSVKFMQITSNLHKISFILGAGLGAFLLLLSIILIVTRYKTSIAGFINNRYYNKILAILFLLIALQQLLSLIS
jgi:threonine/homoserine/homoserine lactone efflux protein